jgi:hypothetical protein
MVKLKPLSSVVYCDIDGLAIRTNDRVTYKYCYYQYFLQGIKCQCFVQSLSSMISFIISFLILCFKFFLSAK